MATFFTRTLMEWVNAVAMATEQGAKGVSAGVAQSVIAGEAIQSLSNSVSVSSQAAQRDRRHERATVRRG